MVQVGQEQAVGIALSMRGFQQTVRWAFKTGSCNFDTKDFMKEMVNAPSPLMGFYAALVPAFLWRWNSREEWKLRHRSSAKASQDKPHCLIQRDINLVGMGTLCPGWGTILRRRIGQCQDRCP